MRAFRELKPPGVYPASDAPKPRVVDLQNTRIAGFVGVAHRGPLDEPVVIHSFAEYGRVFGALPEGYLDRAVNGFFANGGDTCYVVRIAHSARDGELATQDHAACAEWVVLDGWGKPTLMVQALNEGRWGNSIWARVETHVATSTLLTLDLDVGSGEARVNATRGFERGALVRVRSQAMGPGGLVPQEDFIVLTDVEDRMIRWGAETPLNHAYRAAGPTFVDVIEFDLHCSLRERRELYRSLQLSPLSRHHVSRVVNDSSELVRIIDLKSRSPLPHCLPAAGPPVRLQGGRDGVDALRVEDFIGEDRGPEMRTGLQALGSVEDVAVVAVPDAMLAFHNPGPLATLEVQRIQDAMVELCERLQDRMAVLDGPPTRDIVAVREWRARYATSYAALYYPWIVSEHEGRPALCPPSGHVAGVYARTERENGVHKAPANEVVHGAIGVAFDLREDDLGQLNEDAINALRALPGRGVRVWSARTLSDEANWRYVNVRRLFIMLRRAIERGTQWAVFEPNDPKTWDTLGRSVASFLESLWTRGAFAGTTPQDSFYVVCDATTNTPERVDVGQLLVEIGVAPVLPAEYIILQVTQRAGGDDQAA